MPIIEVEIKRYFPPDFLNSANENNGNISVSEKLGKAILVVGAGIDENNIKRGEPNNYEPDFMTSDDSGFEVTFASSRGGNTISKFIKGKERERKYSFANTEDELIKSIADSIAEKAQKKKNGNYKSIENVSVVVISLDPLMFWYGFLHGFNYPHTLKRRNQFFTLLCNEYIANSIFENIYILQITDYQTTVLFDLKEFQNDSEKYITEISSTHLKALPHCTVTNLKMTGDPDTDLQITYKFHDKLWKIDKSL